MADARKELTRIEERALDASSSRQLEALTRDTREFVDMYSERGQAFRDLVADAQDLGSELQQAFDLTEQQARLEDFRDGVADVINDLASVAVDHIFDGFFGAADEATAAIQVFTDVFRGDIELLENDVTRLTRQIEDSKIRLLRLGEDESRRIRQLERQRRSLLARSSTGNQRDAERTRQRAQDISFRISALREDFDVRRGRTQEDADRRRNRSIEDALQRRERAQAEQPSLVGDIGQTLETAMKNALADRLSGYLTKTAFDTGVGLITAGLGALGIGDLLKGFLGGGSEGDGDGTGTGDQTPPAAGDGQDGDQDGTTALTGTLTIPKENITLPEGALDLKGKIALAVMDITAPTDAVALKGAITLASTDITLPTEAVDLTGKISTIDPLADSVRRPPVPGLTGGISRLVLAQGVDRPIVPGLTAEIDSLSITETLEDLPSAPGLEGRIDALTLLDDLSLPMAEGLAGRIDALSLKADLTLPSITGLSGEIANLSVAAAATLPSVNVAGIISSLNFAEGLTPPSLPAYNAIINGIAFG